MVALRRPWAIGLAAAMAAVVVFGAGYASAANNQQQGVPKKVYLASTGSDWETTANQWSPVGDLTIYNGTWRAGDLLVAHVDAETLCMSSGLGWCSVKVGLTGVDPGSPNIEFIPGGGEGFAFAATSADWKYEAHAMTRYLRVPSHQSDTSIVWVMARTSQAGIWFRIDQAVLRLEILTSS